MKSIGWNAFADCTWLTSVVLPTTTSYIESGGISVGVSVGGGISVGVSIVAGASVGAGAGVVGSCCW